MNNGENQYIYSSTVLSIVFFKFTCVFLSFDTLLFYSTTYQGKQLFYFLWLIDYFISQKCKQHEVQSDIEHKKSPGDLFPLWSYVFNSST